MKLLAILVAIAPASGGVAYMLARGYFGFSVFIDYKAGKLVLDAGYNRP